MPMVETMQVTITEAAKILGEAPETVRWKMRKGWYDPPIGSVTKSMSGRQYRYHVYRPALEKYIGGGNGDGLHQ